MDDMPRLADLVPPSLKPGADLVAMGRAEAKDWRLGISRFMRESGFASEAARKRQASAEGRIMQHAHIGFRNVDRTLWAMREIHDKCARAGVTVDRFGITLDWSMGYPERYRKEATRGTGIVLASPEDFSRIMEASPAAAHFGDFMIGLPGALENTRAAIAAGATAVGNLGQYFTFRLPHWDDDVATTEATLQALALIAAQDAEILVHSNLDDGFAGLFLDMACSLGMVIVEKHIVEELVGARLGHCYGHHFSDPLSRMAFHCALAQITDTPGTMIFGNTVSYQSGAAGNYASLSNYLLADIMAMRRWPTGHAVNPVPVTENVRIPDVDEIEDAQSFATRLVSHAPHYERMIDWQAVEAMAALLVRDGRKFAGNLLAGLADRGVETTDAAQMLIAIRRLGPKRIEQLFGPGRIEGGGERTPVVLAEWARELDAMAQSWVARNGAVLAPEAARSIRVCLATSDVHEHGKYLVAKALEGIGVEVVDGGVATDPERLVEKAVESGANVIAVSTYNGVALRYCREVRRLIEAKGLTLPLLVGGRLNEVPADSNSGLPVDVTDDLRQLGIHVCENLDRLGPVLSAASRGSIQN
ncbi:MAG: cobalamin-dependent protein [Parvibaculaceae bacterium]